VIKTLLRTAAVAAVFYSMLSGIVSVAADANFDPDTGLRIHHYTDPVPATVPGAQTLDTQAASELWQSGDALFVDVLSISGVRYDELDGSWSDYPERRNIEGSVWLPNVGYGRPAPDMLRYFLQAVAEATEGNRSHPIVIYCIRDCWMGWNAVQHLADAGYDRLYWYPEGTDGWVSAGHSLALSEPVPVNLD